MHCIDSDTPPHAVPQGHLLHCLWQPVPTQAGASQIHADRRGHLLGRVRYGHAQPAPAPAHEQVDLHIPMCFPGMTQWQEDWYSATPVRTLSLPSAPGLYARYNQHVLWGSFSLQLPEDGQPQARVVQAAYLQLFAALAHLGFRHLWRIWNFIPHINAPNAQGLENYRDFNLGRALAFAQAYDHGQISMPWATREMPAATGIGCLGHALHVYFLAGRAPGQHIENPRQVAAYRYPPEHGPRPPCFARGSVVHVAQQRLVFLSGTASIIGHRTVHVTDVEKQCHTALDNLAMVAARAHLGLHDLPYIKVYVRHAHHLAQVQAICRQRLTAHAQVAYFVVDICRSNLLVEIEALRV